MNKATGQKSGNNSPSIIKTAISKIFRKPFTVSPRSEKPSIIVTSPSLDQLIPVSPEVDKNVDSSRGMIDPSKTLPAPERKPSNGNDVLPSHNDAERALSPCSIPQTKPRSISQSGFVASRMPSAGSDATSSIARQDSKTTPPPNIVIFGETGSGKSSIVNMLASSRDGLDSGTDEIAPVSGEALGCTFDSRSYVTMIDGWQVKLWDTAGLNEGEHGVVPGEKALEHLKDLIGKLGEEGVSLLVYCVRGPRYRDVWKINHDLFWGIICEKKVPVLMCVTGLENEEPTMESWWGTNEGALRKVGLVVDDHACITATRGKRMKDGGYMYEGEYEESRKVVKSLVQRYCMTVPWTVERDTWLPGIETRLSQYGVQPGSKKLEVESGETLSQKFQVMLVRMGKLSV